MVSQGFPDIDLDYILKNVGELNILSHYLGISKIPCIINSPLRIDNNPSFGLWANHEQRIYYTDLATKESGDIYTLFKKKWNLSFQEVLYKIYSEVPIDKSNVISNILNHHTNKRLYNNNVDLKCKVRDWKNYDLEYWEQYGISLKWLKFGDVYPISHIIVIKNNKTSIINADKYAYVYVERKDNTISLKIYQPFSQKFKWSNKHDSSVWDLWTKLPEKGDNLIITSSRKDALCVWENTNIPSISLQAESYLPKEHVLQQLKDRFNNIYVLYDNDFQSEINHGRELGKKLADSFNLKQLEIPEEYKSKDSSDLCKNYGRKMVKDLIPQLIKNYKN